MDDLNSKVVSLNQELAIEPEKLCFKYILNVFSQDMNPAQDYQPNSLVAFLGDKFKFVLVKFIKQNRERYFFRHRNCVAHICLQ